MGSATRFGWAAVVGAALSACTLLVPTDGLSGGAPEVDAGGTSDTGTVDGIANDVAQDAGEDTTQDAGPPSCAGGGVGTVMCGNDVPCCQSNLVPAGDYDWNNNASFPAHVSAFRLDVFEVTVGRFRAFVEAGYGTKQKPPAQGAGAHPKIAGTGWDSSFDTQLPLDGPGLVSAVKCPVSNNIGPTWLDAPGPEDTRPINCVNWFIAYAFCIWDGGRLPTDAEINFAAAGGPEQRQYPWGATAPDPTYAVYNCLADGTAGCTSADLPSVGSRSPKGNGRWGHADLSGSLTEPVFDYFGTFPSPCTDCAVLSPEPCDSGFFCASRRLRGLTWGSVASQMQTTTPDDAPPTARAPQLGIRCARD